MANRNISVGDEECNSQEVVCTSSEQSTDNISTDDPEPSEAVQQASPPPETDRRKLSLHI